MIEVENVSKWYGDFRVLDDCSTGVDKGEVVVVCGPSGSGKSTLIKCINGLEPFQKGKITVDGVSVGDKSTNLPRLRSHIGMLFQDTSLVYVVGLKDFLTAADLIAVRDNRVVELYFTAAAVYFVLCIIGSLWVRKLQRQYAI